MSVLDFLSDELRSLDDRGLRRRFRSVDGPQEARLIVDGREVVNFSSNNYLGLANHPALREAARRALDVDGLGAGASRLIVGNLRAHRALEQALATFHATEAALLFSSGYQANVGILSALTGPEDLILSDALNHASLIDGCRLSRAAVQVYAHCDLVDLERRLGSPARRRFIVTDSIFSMDGTVAPLRGLRELADQHGAILVVDEAHATGTTGPLGRGVAAATGIAVDVHMATLSKAFGGFGAYVAGTHALVEFLANRARSFVFTTASPPSIAAAAQAALQLCQSPLGQELRVALGQRIAQFAQGLRSLGLLAPGAGDTPIFPVLVGDERATMIASELLLERGFFAQGIRPPTVPPGTSRLRFALMATHDTRDVSAALDALSDLVTAGRIPRKVS